MPSLLLLCHCALPPTLPGRLFYACRSGTAAFPDARPPLGRHRLGAAGKPFREGLVRHLADPVRGDIGLGVERGRLTPPTRTLTRQLVGRLPSAATRSNSWSRDGPPRGENSGKRMGAAAENRLQSLAVTDFASYGEEWLNMPVARGKGLEHAIFDGLFRKSGTPQGQAPSTFANFAHLGLPHHPNSDSRATPHTTTTDSTFTATPKRPILILYTFMSKSTCRRPYCPHTRDAQQAPYLRQGSATTRSTL